MLKLVSSVSNRACYQFVCYTSLSPALQGGLNFHNDSELFNICSCCISIIISICSWHGLSVLSLQLCLCSCHSSRMCTDLARPLATCSILAERQGHMSTGT